MDSLVYDLRVPIWLISTAAISLGTYIVWPSRWNIPAHMAIGFYIVSSAIPVAALGALDAHPQTVVVDILKVMILGAFFFIVGLLLGATLARTRSRVVAWMARGSYIDSHTMQNRVGWVLFASIAALVTAILVMGFTPMFAEDPFQAKFFRGAYGQAYAPVAVLYRAGTAIVTILIPVAAIMAVKRGSLTWKLALVVSVGLMVVTLQRGPAFTGLILAAGVLLVERGRVGLFLTLAIGSYIAGTLFYYLLGIAGVASFEGTDLTGGSLLKTIAATAPDIPDAFGFYKRWLAAGEPLTLGRTFFGGLLPGNNPWNPGVWTLTLGNPAIDVRTISSGGLRLPLPIWGLVNFGTYGVIAISLLSGLFSGFLARSARIAIESMTTTASRLWVLVTYSALTPVLQSFYSVSYIAVFRLVALWWIARAPLSKLVGDRSAPEHSRSRLRIANRQ